MLPEILVNATDLDNWAERLDARSTLPRLIRCLVNAAPIQIEQVEFRSDEGTQLGGWDGVLKVTTGNEFIPAGQSGWEFGTNQGVKVKADYEYDNRKDDPGDLDPTKTTFVFVTLRRWGGRTNGLGRVKLKAFGAM